MSTLRKSKYRAVPTYVGTIRFASKAEAARYETLLILEKAGKITDIKLQPKFPLVAGITYVADFSYFEVPKSQERLVVEDVKGMETPVFRLKEKMFRHFYPHIELRLIKKGKAK